MLVLGSRLLSCSEERFLCSEESLPKSGLADLLGAHGFMQGFHKVATCHNLMPSLKKTHVSMSQNLQTATVVFF